MTFAVLIFVNSSLLPDTAQAVPLVEPTLQLTPGYNLIALPGALPGVTDAFGLVDFLGVGDIERVLRYDAELGLFQEARIENNVPVGENFPLIVGEALVVYSRVAKSIPFTGTVSCLPRVLSMGLHLIGIPCPTTGLTAFQFLEDLGGIAKVGSLQRFNRITGQFETALFFEGVPGGANFLIRRGEGYRLTLLAEIPSGPVITDFTPKSASIGTVVMITGVDLNPISGSTSVTFNGVPSTISTLSDTSLKTTVPFGATTGPLTIQTPGGIATTGVDFTINPSHEFVLSLSHTSGSAVQGDSTSFSITANSSEGFSGLIGLTVRASPLPAGLSASFSQDQITGNGSSFLTLTVDLAFPIGLVPLVLTGTSMIDGQAVTREIPLSLNVLAKGTTILAGQVVTDDAMQKPIPNVTLSLKSNPGNAVLSDGSGNFLLQNVPIGEQILVIDASTATTATDEFASVTSVVHVIADQTNRLPVLLHLPRISGAATFATPPNPPEDIVITMGDVPNMSVTIPAGTIIMSADGTTVITEVNIVPLTVDRSPMKLPPGVDAGFIFTVQPEGAVPSQPVPIVYPNLTGIPPGTAGIALFMLDVDLGDFVQYGTGTVSLDGTSIIPDIDPATGRPFGLTKFGWHWAQNPENSSPPPGDEPGGDPVDMATGSLIMVDIDLIIDGGLAPIRFLRTYRTFNTNPGPFGVGTSLNWNTRLRLPGNQNPSNTQSLILVLSGNDRQIFSRQGDGSFINNANPEIMGARITGDRRNGPITLRVKDGSKMIFSGFFSGGALFGPGAGRLIAMSDRNGNTTTITRDSRGNPIQISDPSGRGLDVTFDSANRVTLVTDPVGRRVSYTYNTAGLLATVRDANGGITTYTYDDINRMVSITDPRGTTFLRNTYDDREIKVCNGGVGGGVCTIQVVRTQRVKTQQLADGGIFRFDYSLANPDLPTSRVVATKLTDPLGNSIICRFNASGEMISRTDALGQTTMFEKEIGTNRLLSITDPLGRKTSFIYDGQGNVTSIRDPENNVTRFTYDPIFNLLKTRTDALEQVTTFDYDENGNLITFTDPLLKMTTITYNASGQPVTITDPLINVTRLSYNANGDLIGVNDPLGNKVSLAYDTVSRLIARVNPLGGRTQIDYDPGDRITRLTDPRRGTILFDYDPNGNLHSLTDANENRTLFDYDGKNRRIRVTDPLGKEKTSVYDQGDNLVQFVNRRGETTIFTYDALNRPLNVRFADGMSTQAAYTAVGKLSELTDSVGGTVSFFYDPLDRVTRQTMPTGSVDYIYNELGQRASATVAGQDQITYTYDPLGRLLSLTRGLDAVQFDYDEIGHLLNTRRSNGVDSEFTYDDAGRLTRLVHRQGITLLSQMEYTYDAISNRIGFNTDNGQPLITRPLSQTFDAANRLLSSGSTTFKYDAEGNLISKIDPAGTTRLTWNARNKLVAINGPDLTATFTYDALGRRTNKTINGDRTDFFYDFENIIQESRNSSVLVNYMPGLGLDDIFSRTDSSGTNFLLRDGLGSVTLIANETGGIVNKYLYEPYGETTTIGTAENSFQFTGRENDGSGFYYYRARFYDPTTRRFISEDPIGFKGGGVNIYEYVHSNPTNFIDPTGLFFECIMNMLKVGLERPASIEAVERYQSPRRTAKRNLALAVIPPAAELATAGIPNVAPTPVNQLLDIANSLGQ